MDLHSDEYGRDCKCAGSRFDALEEELILALQTMMQKLKQDSQKTKLFDIM